MKINKNTTASPDLGTRGDDFAQRVRINQTKLISELKPTYDFIVCGSGSSGSVMVGRLAENPDVDVLLLESGGSDETDLVTNPNRWPVTLGSELDWGFVAESNPHLNGRAIPYSPAEPVRIDANYLTDPQDLEDLIAGLSIAREIGNCAALRPFAGAGDSTWLSQGGGAGAFFRDGLGTFWHQSCTAKMGRDAMSVVDGKLKAYGVDGLRIADASIMPRVTTGNTMAP
jgi:choline dehydrogenase-like flavoprotein